MVTLKFQISGIKCPNSTIRIIRAKISGNTSQYFLPKFCLKLFTIIECSMWYKLKTYIWSHLFAILIYAAVLFMYGTIYAILNKSEKATLQYSIFCDKVLDVKYLLKLNNVFQTSSKRFVETQPICLFWCLSYFIFCVLNYTIAHVQNLSHFCCIKNGENWLITWNKRRNQFWIYQICCFCCFTSQVNSYGHGGTVSSPNHTFSWANLNKQLTSTSCTYFRL